MGSNHARVIKQLPDVTLAGVVDLDLDRAKAAAHPAPAFVDLDSVDIAFDAAVVATPTPTHRPIAEVLASRGVHLLVEKPLAGNSIDAAAIVTAADKAGVTLAVGHIERFNAAVAELPRFVEDPIHIHASRIGPYSPRISDGVVFDLMIHDLDIVLSLAHRSSIKLVNGVSRSVRSQTEDIAHAALEFSSGLTASFATSRLGQDKIRSIEVVQADSTVRADLLRQEITVNRMAHHEFLDEDGRRYRQSSVIEVPFLEVRGEPLANELRQFTTCVGSGGAPRVPGSDGVDAVRVAEMVVAAVGSHRPARPE